MFALHLRCVCIAFALRLPCISDAIGCIRTAFVLHSCYVLVCLAFSLRLSCNLAEFDMRLRCDWLHSRCVCLSFSLRLLCTLSSHCVCIAFTLRLLCIRAVLTVHSLLAFLASALRLLCARTAFAIHSHCVCHSRCV